MSHHYFKSRDTWFVKYKIQGKEKRHYTGSGKDGETEAALIDAKIKAGKKKGLSPSDVIAEHTGAEIKAKAAEKAAMATRQTSDYTVTFRWVVGKFIQQPHSDGYTYNLKRCLGKRADPLFGSKAVADLSMNDLLSMDEQMVKDGLSVATRNRYQSYCRAALQWAVDQGLIQTNPFARFRPNKKAENGAPDLITKEELEALLKVAPLHLRWAIRCVINTGVRPGKELFSIQMVDADPERRLIQIHRFKTERGKPKRPIPISVTFAAEIAHLKKHNPDRVYLVEFNGKPINKIRSAWTTAKTKAKITRKLRMHDLRHLYATTLIDAGADLKAVAEILGHSDTRMVSNVYNHLSAGRLHSTVDKLPEW